MGECDPNLRTMKTFRSFLNFKSSPVLMAIVVLLLCLDLSLAKFTPLEIDNHPCTAEKLKQTTKYICDNDGNVICQSGWKNSEPGNPLNPCSEPICHGEAGCENGMCRAPDYCACEVGWEGARCEICIPLPGCEQGTCNNALECNCEDQWAGAYCEIPDCDHCQKDGTQTGRCLEPNECICFDGWTGTNCTQCLPMAGCLHGDCGEHPNTCECEANFEGHLCDQPICTPGCVNGECVEGPVDPTTGIPQDNFCICEVGWSEAACDVPICYWECTALGGTCTQPNQCNCSEADPICENPLINPAIANPSNAGGLPGGDGDASGGGS